MMKKNKTLIIMTSLLCLLPMVFSIAVYSRLPELVAVHWDMNGIANNYMHKAFASFGLPVFFFIINLICNFSLLNDPKKEGHSKTVRFIVLWLIPILSFITVPGTLLIALGLDIPMASFIIYFAGLLLVVIGNYMPKSRQNYTIGVKLPWTLNSEENWNKTHRIAGYTFILGGLLIFFSGFITKNEPLRFYVIITVTLLLALVPSIYSFLLYKKGI